MLVSDLLTAALRALGVRGSGEPPTANELNDGLLLLNQLVDAWGAERLSMYTTAREVFSVVAGQQTYALGPTGSDWIAPRPEYLDQAGLILSGVTPVEIPLRVIESPADWARIRVKSTTSTVPTTLYYESDFPNGTVALWPAPSAASQVALYVPVAVPQFTGTTQTISLPPGYARALRALLAVEWAPEFGVEPSPVLVAQAEEAKASLKRANVQVGRLRCEIGVTHVGNRGGTWDYMLGVER